MKHAYYNENDPAAAHCIRALIADGVIAPGDVDERSIIEVKPDDVRGYTQCHFFAGGSVWQLALRQAGWPDDRPVWTGSCPCQPFSAAGKQQGIDDPRHLWPHLYRLIREVRPNECFGEQVSGKAGYAWLDGVCDDLEAEGYTCGAADIAACAVDAPHQRSRLYWCAVGHSESSRQQGVTDNAVRIQAKKSGCGCRDGATPDTVGVKRRGREQSIIANNEKLLANTSSQPGQQNTRSASGNEGTHGRGSQDDNRHSSGDESGIKNVGNAINPRLERHTGYGNEIGGSQQNRSVPETDGSTSYWGNHWIKCYDGKARRTEPSIFFLVDGIQLPLDAIGSEGTTDLQEAFPKNRIEAWRIAGNAIVPQLAVEFIKSVEELR